MLAHAPILQARACAAPERPLTRLRIEPSRNAAAARWATGVPAIREAHAPELERDRLPGLERVLREAEDELSGVVGTDGADGPTDAAGAFADAGTLPRARALGLDAHAALEANDAYGFFDREGGLLRTGPTGTNGRNLVVIQAG